MKIYRKIHALFENVNNRLPYYMKFQLWIPATLLKKRL